MAARNCFFAESLETFVQDLNRARPTVTSMSVPASVAEVPARRVRQDACPSKLDRLLSIPIAGQDSWARKVLKGLGLDQALLAASGSAPIPAELIASGTAVWA